MTDRELLELAAKAAGFGADIGGFIWTCSEYPRGTNKNGALWNYKGWHDTAELWNPLTDDGDALRLAVQLGFVVEPGRCWHSHYGPAFGEDVLCDVMAATRRAIVRAAAEVGRSM